MPQRILTFLLSIFIIYSRLRRILLMNEAISDDDKGTDEIADKAGNSHSDIG